MRILRRLWRSLVLWWRRWQRRREEVNRRAAGVMLHSARAAWDEQQERERQLGVPEPSRPAGSRMYWRIEQ